MKYKVILEDKQTPAMGVLTCVIEASSMAEALIKAEDRYPYYHAFYATMILGGLKHETEQ